MQNLKTAGTVAHNSSNKEKRSEFNIINKKSN